MSEYLEAISRLNAPERTPGTTISRWQYPIPPKNTSFNYNKIMRETGNTPLPKYSIPQRLFIENDGSNIYAFPLDKQFTLAPGGRKTIAIREIGLHDILNGVTEVAYRINVNISLIYFIGESTEQTILDVNDYIDFRMSFDPNISKEEYYSKLAFCLCENISKLVVDYLTNTERYPILWVPDHSIPDNTITITAVPAENIEFGYIEEFNVKIDQFAPANHSMLNIKHTNNDIDNNYNDASFTIQFDETNYFELISVCSSLNPWSSNNIIGSPAVFHQHLNKIFPYDGSQEAKFWFINDKGERIFNNKYRGYIDLELIIDNLNNFVMDD